MIPPGAQCTVPIGLLILIKGGAFGL
ncbi:protein of unknown function [Streptomyces sp. KY75]|nr:protein of unknown function [Streptomyces sp. KY75]CAD5991316.1 protein of unknown function [Streptomyces sp. KY70]